MSAKAIVPTRGHPLYKYVAQRHQLFSRFDEGILLDAEGWYSVTPERIAQHIARRCACGTMVDAFCGVGGNAIQFAMTCDRVIAIDSDADRLALAEHNARIYGVHDRIEFIHGDFFQVMRDWDVQARPPVDGVFMSPPWGGPEYLQQSYFDVDFMLKPYGAQGLMSFVRTHVMTSNMCLFLPRNVNVQQLRTAVVDDYFDLEMNQVNGRVKTISLYTGRFRQNYHDA